MNEIKWQEPPAPTRRSWVGIRAALMERPGEWALVGESISRQQAYAVKRPGFEVRTDSAPHANGLIDLYMRYVGEVSA